MISSWLYSEISISIAAGLITSAVVAVIAVVWRHGIVQALWERLSLTIFWYSASPESSSHSYRKMLANFVRWLRADQSRKGPHYGQFGLHAAIEEEARYQTGHEELAAKPRMFLTLWPVEILRRRGLLDYSIAIAVRGVERLLINGRVRVFQSAENRMSPTRSASVISFRHTLAAALILISSGRWSRVVHNIVGAMLDEGGGWQNQDGGWAQCDRQYTESDIYASSYALRILFESLKRRDFDIEGQKVMETSLDRTLSYFEEVWSVDKWKYGDVSSEENAPYVLSLIAPVLLERRPLLARSVIAHMRSWMTQANTPSQLYLHQCANDSLLALCSRLAYAMYRAGAEKVMWHSLFEYGLEHLGETANSAEISFMLDLLYVARGEENIAIKRSN